SSRTRERRSASPERSPPSPRRRAVRGAGTGRTCRARTVPAYSQSPSEGIISPALDRIEPRRQGKELEGEAAGSAVAVVVGIARRRGCGRRGGRLRTVVAARRAVAVAVPILPVVALRVAIVVA